MNFKKWVWCWNCERCFEVFLSREPGGDESPFNFGADFEMQLGVDINGSVYAECPYDACDGSLLNFHWWAGGDSRLEVPEPGVVYSLHPVPGASRS